jgi:hypothetical protein
MTKPSGATLAAFGVADRYGTVARTYTRATKWQSAYDQIRSYLNPEQQTGRVVQDGVAAALELIAVFLGVPSKTLTAHPYFAVHSKNIEILGPLLAGAADQRERARDRVKEITDRVQSEAAAVLRSYQFDKFPAVSRLDAHFIWWDACPKALRRTQERNTRNWTITGREANLHQAWAEAARLVQQLEETVAELIAYYVMLVADTKKARAVYDRYAMSIATAAATGRVRAGGELQREFVRTRAAGTNETAAPVEAAEDFCSRVEELAACWVEWMDRALAGERLWVR